MQERPPRPDAVRRRAALHGVAEHVTGLLRNALTDRRGRHLDVPFSEISPNLVRGAFDGWRNSFVAAEDAAGRALRRMFPHGADDHTALRDLTDVLVERGEPLAAALVQVERARDPHYLNRATRPEAAGIERSAAALLEQAGRPHEAYPMYMSAYEKFSADPGRAESARECRDAADLLRGTLGDVSLTTKDVARARAAEHTAVAVAAEWERRARENRAFFNDGTNVNGVNKPAYQSTGRLIAQRDRHLAAGDRVRAEVDAWQIHDRLSHDENAFRGVRTEGMLANERVLAGLLERRGAAHAAVPLREDLYLAAVRAHGHSDPRTMEAARDHVDGLRAAGVYARSFALAGRALRRAYTERIRDLLRSRALRGRTVVDRKAFEAAHWALTVSGQLAHIRTMAGSSHEEPGGERARDRPRLLDSPRRPVLGRGGARPALSGPRAAVPTRPRGPRLSG